MFNDMTKEHKGELRKLVILAIATLLLNIIGYRYDMGIIYPLLFFVLYLLSAKDVLIKAIQMLKRGQALDENFLMSIATITAFIIGEYTEATSVMLFYGFGELFEEIATYRSKENIKGLLDLVPDVANKINEDGSIEVIDLDEVKVGDILLIRDGEKIGVDGVVIDGHGLIDTSSVTGESMPVEVMKGSSIISSSIVTDGIIKIKAQREFEDSVAAKIIELIEDSAGSKSTSEKTITKFARVYTPIVVAIAIVLAIIPPLFFGGAWDDYLFRAATFLVLSCPCALVLSVPLSFMSGLGLASENGILIKGSQYFEELGKASVLLTDKTGTLTTGDFVVKDIEFTTNYDKEKILDYIYNIELMSTHPIAQGIVNSLKREEKKDLFKEIINEKGLGVKAITYDNRVIKIGSIKYAIDGNKSKDRAVYVSLDGDLVSKILIEDQIKNNSHETIDKLKKYFKKIAIVSGDNKLAVKNTAYELGIDDYYSEVLPSDKLQIMKKFQDENKGVVFVGDGINDAPVLQNADVGISMGETASDLAIESSDILIVNGEFSQMSRLMKITSITNKTVRENIVFIMSVKIIILFLGLIGYANMWLAIFGDVGVSIIAILRSMRLLKFKI